VTFENQHIKRVAIQVELSDGEIIWMYSESPTIEIDVEAVPGRVYLDRDYLTRTYADPGHYNVTLSYLQNFVYGAQPPAWQAPKEVTDGSEYSG